MVQYATLRNHFNTDRAWQGSQALIKKKKNATLTIAMRLHRAGAQVCSPIPLTLAYLRCLMVETFAQPGVSSFCTCLRLLPTYFGKYGF